MNDISPLGWIAISICGILLVITNLSLITLLRRNNQQKQSDLPMGKILDTLKNPWGAEDRQWQELSRQVEGYKPSASNHEDLGNPEQGE
jgi:hypothetical protein